jgi:hypothetical protein
MPGLHLQEQHVLLETVPVQHLEEGRILNRSLSERNDWGYFFKRFSLCFLLFSSLSFLVIGFFLVAPVLNAITALK